MQIGGTEEGVRINALFILILAMGCGENLFDAEGEAHPKAGKLCVERGKSI